MKRIVLLSVLLISTLFITYKSAAQAPGNVGVGNNSPQEKFHVSGGFIRSDTLAGTGNAYMVLDQDGNLAFRINHNGQNTYVLTGAGTLVDITTLVPTAFDKFVDSVQVFPPTFPSTTYTVQMDLNDGSSTSFSIDIADYDNDPTNEIQDISLSGTDLAITGGSTVDLSALQDGTGTDDQTISLTGTTLAIEDGNNVDLSVLQDGTGTDDQQISISGNVISLEDGGTITLPADQVDDADADPTNEIQDISLSGTGLAITGGSTVDLSTLQDGTGTDDQQISISGNVISLEDGGTITLPADQVDDADADPTNELNTSAQLVGNILQITDAGGTLNIDLSSIANTPDNDSDSTNEIQVISLSNDTLFISGGNSVDLGNFAAPHNEIVDADNDTKVQVEESPDDDIIRFDMAGTEFFRMDSGRIEVVNTGGSVFLGQNAGLNDDFSSNANTFIGTGAGQANTSGSWNTVVGSGAFSSNTTGNGNQAIGNTSLTSNTTGRRNTAVGDDALQSSTTADDNIAIGNAALAFTTTGGNNVAVGRSAGRTNILGRNNVMIGHEAGRGTANHSKSGSVFIGHQAGYFETDSNRLYIENTDSNTPLIYGEFDSDLVRINGTLDINDAYQFPTTDGSANYLMQTDGAGNVTWVDPATISTADDNDWTQNGTDIYTTTATNVGVGTTSPTDELHVVGDMNIDAGHLWFTNNGYSVFIGDSAGANDNFVNNFNTFVGHNAGKNNTSGEINQAFGSRALESNTSGDQNSAYGNNALRSNIWGNANAAFGSNALENNISGHRNVAVGHNSLRFSTTATDNIAIGNFSSHRRITGDENVAVGFNALSNDTAGTRNVAVGTEALLSNESGNKNVALGYRAGANETGSNKLYIENSGANSGNALIYGEFDNDYLQLNAAVNINGTYQFPTADGSANYLMQTDGAGNVTWVDPATISTADDNDWVINGNDMYNTNTGNVGIGTVGPGDNLEVFGTTASYGITIANPRPVLTFNDTDANGWTIEMNARDFRITEETLGDVVGIDDATGNVGIGITNPQARLDVRGDANGTPDNSLLLRSGNNQFEDTSNQILFGWDGGTGYKHALKTRHKNLDDEGNAFDFYVWDFGTDGVQDIGTKPVMTIDGKDEGMVGIGTRFPNSELHISDGSSSLKAANDAGGYGASLLITDNAIPRIYFEAAGQGANKKLMDISYLGQVLGIGSLTDNAFAWDNQYILAAHRDGNVGVGTGNPQAKLHVEGNIRMVDGNQAAGNIMVSDINGTATWTDSDSLGTSILQDTDKDTKIQVEENPDEDIVRIDMEGTQRFALRPNRINWNTINGNVMIGQNSGQSLTTGYNNTGLGQLAMVDNTSGRENTGLGAYALTNNTTGERNTGLGTGALESNTTASQNTAVGYYALRNAQTNGANTAVGNEALEAVISGGNNVAMGLQAFTSLLVGNDNVGIGNNTFHNSDTAWYNIAVGWRAGYNVDYGERNVLMGYLAGAGNASHDKSYNVMIGHQAGHFNEGNANVFLGYQAGMQESGNNKLYIENSNSTSPLIYGEFNNDLVRINGTLDINDAYQFPVADGSANYLMQTDGSGNVTWVDPTSISTADDGDWAFNGNHIYKANSGNVGIGETNPQASLDVVDNAVVGNINLGSESSFQGASSVHAGDGFFVTPWIYSNAIEAPAERGAAGTAITVGADGNYGANDEIHLVTNGDSRLMVNNNGRVGISKDAPTVDLHIKQSQQSTTGGTGGIRLEESNSTDYWQIHHSGIHLSFTEDGVRQAYVEGGTGNYIQTSDKAFKKNIEPIGPVLDKLLQLSPVKYHYLSMDEGSPKTQGFIAQDVETVFPEIVKTDEEGNKALAYDDFAILSIKAIQEQQEIIEDLKSQIEILIEKNAEQDAIIEDLKK